MTVQAVKPITLTLREVYERLCPKCKNHIRSLVRDKIADQLVDQAIGIQVERRSRKGR